MIENSLQIYNEECKTENESKADFRNKIPEISGRIIQNSFDKKLFSHIDYEPLPEKEIVIDIINKFMDLLYPGYFSREKTDPVNMKYYIGRNISDLSNLLCDQITRSIRHDCIKYNMSCVDCESKGQDITLSVLNIIPEIRETLSKDVEATYEGDPAAQSHDEIIFSYPGVYAISVYRIANHLYNNEVPLLPRIMTEYAHCLTGIDIHPGATIGESFVIDHGTGVVIGETTVIGNNVRIYQGVTLGALSLPKGAGKEFKGIKRHPTIEDDVIIYSGATILGGETVIGAKATVGGNVWITESVEAGTKVIIKNPDLSFSL